MGSMLSFMGHAPNHHPSAPEPYASRDPHDDDEEKKAEEAGADLGSEPCDTATAPCPLLDSLFTWASQEYQKNKNSVITVRCNFATNQSTVNGSDKNQVTFGDGILYYSDGNIEIGSSFSNIPNAPVVQYYSTRLYGSPIATNPFNPAQTDQVNVTIRSPRLLPSQYSVIVGLSGQPVRSFTPQCGGGVIYGLLDSEQIMTISLCNKSSRLPPS